MFLLCREQHMMERISSEQSRPHKAALLEGAPSLRHALGKLSLEKHSLKPVHEEDDPDVQQVEMLLQAYFIQMDNTFNQLETMNEYISDTEVATRFVFVACSCLNAAATVC